MSKNRNLADLLDASGDVKSGSLDNVTIADNAVTMAKIADADIVTLKSGRKNLLINGGFDVWQRGTSSTLDNTYATADRWFKYASGDTSSWGKGTDSSVGNYCTVTANSTGYCNLRQKIEGFHISGSTDFTLSFYMKGSTGGFPIRLEVWNLTDTNDIHSSENIATGTTAWTKYTVTFQMDGTDTFDNIHVMLGSNGAAAGETLYLSQVQLELGSVATDFEHRSYGEELALCQRYFELVYFGGTAGARWTTRDYTGGISFAVTKRALPTITYSGSIALMNNASMQTGITMQNWSSGLSGMNVRAIGTTVTDGASSIISPDSSPLILISSEL